MAVTFSYTLTCKHCETLVRFENERPQWKTYDVRVEHPERVEAAAVFVQEHADEVVPRDYADMPGWAKMSGMPSYVSLNYSTMTVELAVPDPARYIECPVCDDKVWGPTDG